MLLERSKTSKGARFTIAALDTFFGAGWQFEGCDWIGERFLKLTMSQLSRLSFLTSNLVMILNMIFTAAFQSMGGDQTCC